MNDFNLESEICNLEFLSGIGDAGDVRRSRSRSSYSISISKRYLRWLRHRSLDVLLVHLRRLSPRRLDFIFDLKMELQSVHR
jgi:hypothetical protein